MLDPITYATELTKRMRQHNAKAWLVNTGWIGGAYGTGRRIDLPSTRRIIDAILDGTIDDSEYRKIPIFDLSIPEKLTGLDSNLLDPAKAWSSVEKWRTAATDLAVKFTSNFDKFTSNRETALLAKYGPKI